MAGTGMDLMRSRMATGASRLTTAQKVALGAAFLAVAGGLLLLSRFNASTEMAILYADLDADAATAVVDGLESRGVEYQLSGGGRTIKVPKAELYETRLALSAEGLPDGGGGWEILDQQGLTASEFDQRVGFQRAMEGELSRTIGVIEGVERANVHLVIPRRDLFVTDDSKASASVMLELAPGATIGAGQVQSIVNLVSSSVEGVAPAAVTVTDNLGRTLAAPGGSMSSVLEGEQRGAQSRAVEQAMAAQLESMLAAVVGPGNAVVVVQADLDFDSVVTTREEYRDPQREDGGRTVQGETSRVEAYTGVTPGVAGVLGAEDQLVEGQVGANGETNYNLEEQDTTYAVDKTVTSTERAPGVVRSLSVAVLLDETVIGDDARMGEIQTLVEAASGIDVERGDTVAVTRLPFDTTQVEALAADAEAAAEVRDRAATVELVRTAGTVLLAVVLLVLGVFLVRKGRKRKVLESIDLSQFAELARPVALQPGEPIDDGDDDADKLKKRKKMTLATDPTVDDLASLIQNQPDEVAALLRSCMGPTGAPR